jgi:hypothetical protein
MNLLGIKERRKTKEQAKRDAEYEQYVDRKIDAANTPNPDPRALNELCDLFKSPYWEQNPDNVDHRKTILAQRLNALDLSRIVGAIIEKAYPSIFHGSERDAGSKTSVSARDDLARFVASYFGADPKLWDKAIELMDKEVDPQKYRFLTQTLDWGYDTMVLDAFKQKLTSHSFGPWTDYMAHPLIDSIIANTFTPNIRVDLRERGVEFLVDELKVKLDDPKKTPRNMLYVAKVASALWQNRLDPVVAKHSGNLYNLVHRQAQMYADLAMFSALTSMCNPNRGQAQKVEEIYLGGSLDTIGRGGVFMLMQTEMNPQDHQQRQANQEIKVRMRQGGLNAVQAYVQEKDLSREEIFKIPTAGVVYDRVPYLCEKTSRELFGIIGTN